MGIDDADLRSGEEVSCEEDKTIEETKESPSQPSCSMMTPVLHHGMMMSAMTAAAAAASSSSSSTSRRNKRKNFQPRNIRPNEEEQDNNDTNNSRETTTNNNPAADADGSDDRDELAMPSDGPAACCSISESKITTISSGHRERTRKSNKKSRDAYSSSGCDVADQSNHVAATESAKSRISRVTSDDDEDVCSSRSSSSSRSSHSHNGLISRNSSSSSSQASSHNRSNTAVDLRLRPAFHTGEEEDEEDEEEEEEDEVNNQMSDVSGLEMKTWMLFWQQQSQSCNSNDGKPSFLLPPSVSHRQRPSDQQADLAASETTQHAGRRQVSSNYAETTMRELLGIYGLQRGAPAPAVDSLPSG